MADADRHEGRAPPARRRERNPFYWSDVDRCRLLIVLTLPFFAAYALRSAYLLAHPEIEPYYDREALVWMRDGLALTCGLSVAVLAWGRWVRRRPEPHTGYLISGSLMWWVAICGVAYLLGPLTTPAWIAVLIGGIANLLLLPRPIAILATGTGMTLMVASVLAVMAGWIPYAPVLPKAPVFGGQVSQAFLLGTLLASVFASLLIFAVVDYVVVRWRRALDHLEQVNRNLEWIVAERTGRLVQTERQLQQAQKMEALGRLAGGIAHDFNNLLGVIVAYSDLLLRENPSDAPLGRNVSAIRKAAARAARLVEQLLATGRRQILKPRPLELNGLIEESVELLQSLLGEEVELVLRLDSELGTVEVDPGQMQQVLLNLANNARDAMPKSGRLTIETANLDLHASKALASGTLPSGRYVRLALSDTGRGIPAELHARVFEPFFTTKEPGQGSGLGLSSVYGTVAQSGGVVDLESRPGEGASFRIFLPRVDAAVGPEERAPAQTPPGVRPATILLVEDDAGLRRTLCRVLEAQGHKVFSAADGVEALERIRSLPERIELLVTDVVMPRLGGRGLAEKLAVACPEARVLFMTGHTDDTLLLKGFSASEVDFLRKPFSLDELEAAVARVLEAGE